MADGLTSSKGKTSLRDQNREKKVNTIRKLWNRNQFYRQKIISYYSD